MDGYKLNRRLHEFRTLFSIRTYCVNMKMILNDPSVYPDMPRKSRLRRMQDNLIWLLKNHEVNRYYNTYGLDIEGFRKPDDFMPYRKFAIQRDDSNLKLLTDSINSYNRICILRDKNIFAAFVSETVGKEYAVPVLATTNGRFVKINRGKKVPFKEYFDSRKHCDSIIKSANGECGDEVYLLHFNGANWECNHQITTLEEFAELIKSDDYIVQDRIIQHEKLNAINPTSVNTIRFVTILDRQHEAQTFAHFLRFGVGASIKDNRATGGYAININEDGKLGRRAIGHHDSITIHPDTGFVFEGFQMPYWDETIDLVKRVHENIPDIRSIGWDVAITPDGPVLIEGNDNWEICGPQDMQGGLKERWNALINS